MANWRDKAKNFGRKIRSGVDRGVNEYNSVIDKIKEPEVAVGITPTTMAFIGGGILLVFLLFKKK